MDLLRKLPVSAYLVLGLMTTLLPVMALFFKSGQTTLAQTICGVLYVLVGVIATLGAAVYERGKKQEVENFESGLKTDVANTDGLKSPQDIADAENLRKQFERGIAIYRNQGKDIYGLPWFVVVGEPRSGKTEMVRRGEIDLLKNTEFQDYWQGVGGTTGMHWWFTNKAVILDTAGRFFISQGASSDQRQWHSFLRMLKASRPDRPIDGLILAIPANRLLTHPDSGVEEQRLSGPDGLDANAGEIARQMEKIRSELGIRFPVYVTITKVDKLNGFREFFENVEPEERLQIMGWSNPEPLGAHFDPSSVAEYLRLVAERLRRRMMSELRSVTPNNAAGSRIDDVDGLYAFPTTFESMSGKLTRYLQAIFTNGAWSKQPPFLRGIYFTSSLQSGRVLDQAIAAAKRESFDREDGAQRDEDNTQLRHISYFVRDLFLQKIFLEKGLVKPIGRAKPPVTGWKLWVPVGILGVLAAVGIWGALDRTLNPRLEEKQWDNLFVERTGQTGFKRMVSYDEEGEPSAKLTADPDADKLLAQWEKLGECVSKPPSFGWIFAPARALGDGLLGGDLTIKRRTVFGKAVTESVAKSLENLENGLIEEFKCKEKGKWGGNDWKALHALIILRCAEPSEWIEDKFKGAPELTKPKLLAASELLAALRKAALLPAIDPDPLAGAIALALRQTDLAPDSPPDLSFLPTLKQQVASELSVFVREKIITDKDLNQANVRLDLLASLKENLGNIVEADAAAGRNINLLEAAISSLDKILTPTTVIYANEQAPIIPEPPTTGLCGSETALTKFIRENPEIWKKLGYNLENAKAGVDESASALDSPELLKHLAFVLKIVKGDLPFTADNFVEFKREVDEFSKSTSPSPPASPLPPAQTSVPEYLKKVDKIKKWWFNTTFVNGGGLKNHLVFPIVQRDTKDAKDKPKSGDEDSLRFLLQLVKYGMKIAGKDGIPKEARFDKLDRCFEFFFNKESIDKPIDAADKDKLPYVRELEVTLRLPSKKTNWKYEFSTSNKKESFEFVNNLTKKIRPDGKLKIHRVYAGLEPDLVGVLEPWELIQKIELKDVNEDTVWKYEILDKEGNPVGPEFQIEIPGKGKNLNSLKEIWLPLKAFDAPETTP